MKKRLATVFYVAVISFLLAEVVLRFWSLVPGESEIFTNDPEVGFRMHAGYSWRGELTSSRGFNDTEFSKEPGRRIAFIGDSFVFGVVPREDNFVFRFEDMARANGWQVNVANLGIPASGPRTYIGLMESDAVAFNAADVFVVFFVGNDIMQSHPDFRTRVWFGAPRSLLRSPYLVKPSLDYLYVWKLFRSGLRLTRHNLVRNKDDSSFAEGAFMSVERDRLAICHRRESAMVAAGYRGAAELFARMKETAQRHGQRLTVVLAPDNYQTEPALRRKLAEWYDLDLADYDFEKPQRRLTEALDALDVPVIDLLPAFAAYEGPLYVVHNSHWDKHGNDLAARVIYKAARHRRGKGRERIRRTMDADPT